MALMKGWLDRLRGREPATPPAEPPPLTAPPGQPAAPAMPGGPPTERLPAAAPLPAGPAGPVPPPYTPAPPLTRPAADPTGGVTGLVDGYQPPGSDLVPPRDPSAALRQALGEPPAPAPARGGFLGRLRVGLSRSSQRLTGNLSDLFQKRLLDEADLETLEEGLIAADLGVAASARVVGRFRGARFGAAETADGIRAALAAEIATILDPVAVPLAIVPARRPHVVLVVGVNGTGKTTTIAKLGRQQRQAGLSVTFVAGDTFRAAAVEQLQVWAERTGCGLEAPAKPGADAAGLAFDALTRAREAGTQLLLVDTAGRLHNKAALMEELRKMVRVLRRLDPEAPHSVLLVLDATTGQNALQQVRVFKEMVDVTGLVVTKLDGSARGGVVVALAEEFGLPVHAVGVGEQAADLRPFAPADFARSLVGLS